LHEARRGGAVYDVMVEGDCQVEEIARFNALINNSWFAGDAADDKQQRLSRRRNTPTSTAASHASRSHTNRSGSRHNTRGIPATDCADEAHE
jgi:hypothetical protein